MEPLRFGAMGSPCELVVVGGAPSLREAARERIEQLEQCWSRFRADSELCAMNRAAGHPVHVSPDLFALVERAVAAWHWSRSRFDPTVLRAIETSGYDRSFEQLDAAGPGTAPAPTPTPGCAGIVLDREASTVELPLGVGIDAGGIGKGLCADMVAGELLAAGAEGVSLNMGGDIRVAGTPPVGERWRLGIANPYDASDLITIVSIESGGIATSTSLIRRWSQGDRPLHHLFDPATGAPTPSGVDAVTAIAPEAWRAEVAAKAALVAGPETATFMLKLLGAVGVVVRAVDDVEASAGFDALVDPAIRLLHRSGAPTPA